MYQLFAQIASDDVVDFIFDLAVRIGSAALVMAGVAALIWRWFIRDRWENAVRKVMIEEDEENSDEVRDGLVEEVSKLSSDVRDLDNTIHNGLEARMIRVEDHVEKLVAGQARMEGIMQVVLQQGGN